jgi:hypothetical protein
LGPVLFANSFAEKVADTLHHTKAEAQAVATRLETYVIDQNLEGDSDSGIVATEVFEVFQKPWVN